MVLFDFFLCGSAIKWGQWSLDAGCFRMRLLGEWRFLVNEWAFLLFWWV